MKKVILVVLIIFMCLSLVGCYTIARDETLIVDATVTELDYRAPYSTMVPVRVGKITTMRAQPHPAHYYVTITYKNESETFDDESLYNKVSKGDTIKMELYKCYDENDELIYQTLSLPE